MGLTRVAITRPIFIFMLMAAAVMMGTIAFRSMRVEQNPDVQFGVITITTLYPGAGPDEVATLVSRKVEEAAAGVNGMREVTSTSQEGVSLVFVQFDVGTDMNEALNDLRSKVDQIAATLPLDVEKPTIAKFDTSTEPVMYMVVRSPRLSAVELRDLIDEKISDRFGSIPGVAGVGVNGGEVREIQVRVKKDNLLAYGIGILDVQRAIAGATLNVPSGHFEAGEDEYSVRVLGEFGTVDQIRNMMLTISDPKDPNAKPAAVRLSDIATVVDGTEERRSYSRLNSSDAVVLTLSKAREGNAIEISRNAHEVMKSVEDAYGLEFIVVSDQSEQISESLFDLNFSLMFGVFLVGLIVYIFLHNLRGTIIVGIAIPICIFAAFIVMWLVGFTINNMSMLALSLAVGVLVDDAIVVLENIYRHLRMGEEPRLAALNGRGEIGLAAIAITLADVVVFVPIGLMGGIVGQFFRPLGIVFAVTVLMSLFVSFTVTPMLASRWYRKGEDMEHVRGGFPAWFERNFNRLRSAYRRALQWSLAHRWFVFISGFVALFSVFSMIGGSMMPGPAQAAQSAVPMLGVALVIGLITFVVNIFRGYVKPRLILSSAAFGMVFVVAALVGHFYASWKGDPLFKFQFFPNSDSGSVQVQLELPPGASLSRTQRAVEEVERIVARHPDTEYVLSTVGSRGGGFGAGDRGTNYAQVRVSLKDRIALLDRLMFWNAANRHLRTKADTEVAADMLEMIGRLPGVNLVVAAGSDMGFGAPIQMSFVSEDRAELTATAQRIKEFLQSGAIKGVISPDISSKPGKPEIRAVPDRDRLADADLDVSAIGATMRMLYEGNNDTKFRVRGKEYDIRVMMDIEDRNNPAIMEQLPITFRQGNPIFLTQVANIERGVALDRVQRRSRVEQVTLTANLLPGYAAGTVQAEITKALEENKLLPPTVKKQDLGQADVQAREQGYLFSALLLGLVLVYMLLASLYDNLLYPLIIQLAQPQAMVGALLALIVTDKTLNIVGFVGIITLVGLVGKNAILLVDYTNTLRARGMSRYDALVEAGPTRLRPILMTSLAIVLGMLPVALAIGRGSEFRETIGITIIGGIILSTVLTLMIIPCSYTIFDDASIALGRLLHRRRDGTPPDSTPPDLLMDPEPSAKL